MFYYCRKNDAERVASNRVRRNGFCCLDDERIAAPNRARDLDWEPVKLDEAGFSLAKVSGYSQKFNNDRVFFNEVNIIRKISAHSYWSINHLFFVHCWMLMRATAQSRLNLIRARVQKSFRITYKRFFSPNWYKKLFFFVFCFFL